MSIQAAANSAIWDYAPAISAAIATKGEDFAHLGGAAGARRDAGRSDMKEDREVAGYPFDKGDGRKIDVGEFQNVDQSDTDFQESACRLVCRSGQSLTVVG